jgi:hypothetical protein
MFYPERTITLTSHEPSEPSYVTPELKSMLRRRNTLMRASRVEQANAISVKIGAVIIKRNSAHFKESGSKYDPKGMWAKVRQLSNRSQPRTVCTDITATDLTNNFCAISQDQSYSHPPLRLTVTKPSDIVSESDIFYLLDHLKPTATGLDNLPSWFLKISAPFIAVHVSDLFNMSINSSVVPV